MSRVPLFLRFFIFFYPFSSLYIISSTKGSTADRFIHSTPIPLVPSVQVKNTSRNFFFFFSSDVSRERRVDFLADKEENFIFFFPMIFFFFFLYVLFPLYMTVTSYTCVFTLRDFSFRWPITHSVLPTTAATCSHYLNKIISGRIPLHHYIYCKFEFLYFPCRTRKYSCACNIIQISLYVLNKKKKIDTKSVL